MRLAVVAAFAAGLGVGVLAGCPDMLCTRLTLDTIPTGTYPIASTSGASVELHGEIVVTRDTVTIDAVADDGETFAATYVRSGSAE